MKITRKAIQEMAQRIYDLPYPPRSIEALETIVDEETGGKLKPRKLRRITEKVADCEVQGKLRRAPR